MRAMMYPLLLSVLGFTPAAFAVSESGYEKAYLEKVWPYFQSGTAGTFKGVDNLSIHYITFSTGEKNSQCLFISPGRQEQVEKYAELIYDLKHTNSGRDLSIFVMDHRGQGSSGRMLQNPEIGYVEHFDDYVTDEETFFEQVIKPQGCAKYYLFAHSMGGAIGLGLVAKNPTLFSAATFNSPMWQISTKPFPAFIARALVGAETAFGQGASYGATQTDLDIDTPFEKNITTHSEARYKTAEDLYREFPQTKLGGVSNRWVKEALRFTTDLRKKVKGLALPITLLESGQDEFVKVQGEDKICAQNPNCSKTL